MEPRRARLPRAGPAPKPGIHDRHWRRAFTGIGLAALATTWAAGSPADANHPPPVPHRAATLTSVTRPAPQTPPAPDTLTVNPVDVPASSTQNFRFSYTTATKAGQTLAITIDVPPGWTAPKAVPPALPTDPGAVTVDCLGCSQPNAYRVIPADHKIAVIFQLAKPVDPGKPAVIITYGNVTVPGSAGASKFDAAEQPPPRFSRAGSTAQPVAFDPAPEVTVTCADGTGTVQVSPNHVTVASVSMMTFTYIPAGGCGLVGGAVSLVVPAGWIRPSATPGTGGYVSSDLGPQSVGISGTTVTVSGITLAAGQQFTITYNQARAPAAATTSAFIAAEKSAAAGSLTLLAPPQVAVRPASTHSSRPPPASPTPVIPSTPASPPPTTTGPPAQVTSTGVMTVSPGSIAAGHPSTLTFTYQPPGTGLPAAGEVLLTVPAGWTAPSEVPGTPGYTSAAPGAARVSGRQILVTGAALAAGQPLTISYHPAAAPRAAGSSVFGASQRASTAAVLTALTDPPSVAVTGPSPFHIPATVGFILLAAACAAGLAAARFLRRRRPRPPPPPPPAVNTVPHAGPPGAVTVQPSRTEATHSMRIEPHPAAAVTTIEESAP